MYGPRSDASVNVNIGILLVSVHDVQAKVTRFAVLKIPCQNYFQHDSKNNSMVVRITGNTALARFTVRV